MAVIAIPTLFLLLGLAELRHRADKRAATNPKPALKKIERKMGFWDQFWTLNEAQLVGLMLPLVFIGGGIYLFLGTHFGWFPSS